MEKKGYIPFPSLSFHFLDMRCGSLDMDLGSGYDLWESGYNDGEVYLKCGSWVWIWGVGVKSSLFYSMMEDKNSVGHLVSTIVSVSISVS